MGCSRGYHNTRSAASAVFTWSLAIRASLILGIPLCYIVSSSLFAEQKQESSTNIHYSRRELLAKWLDEDDMNLNCTPAAILDFPEDLFSDTQRRQGAVVLHFLLAFYLFILLAVACDDYFVPAIEKIVEVLQVSDDVGGATLMAAATSSPELFINVVGTFVTEGDVGVGAVLGSAVFNILAVPACCGIFSNKDIYLDWWPMTRDCAMYALSVVALIIFMADELIYWYEAAVLVGLYIFYIILMYNNVAMSAWVHRVCPCWIRQRLATPESSPLLLPHQEKHDKSDNNQQVHEDSLLGWLKELSPPLQAPYGVENMTDSGGTSVTADAVVEIYNSEDSRHESEKWYCDISLWKILTAPIRSALWLTIPNCRKHGRFYPVTFVMCIVWIGATTYVITWMITLIGDTLRIPDSVMGITFLAAGTSVPEAVSSVIVTRQGHGGMGISNSLGSNTFDILLCLGLPWLIKSSMLALVTDPVRAARDMEFDEHAVIINSRGLEYSAISLLSSTLLLYVTFSCYHFRLNRKVGIACLVLYAAFLCLASTIELNVFFTVNLPTCGR